MKKNNTLSFSILILILTLEISFIRSTYLNIWIIVTGLILLIISKHFKGCILVLFLPFIPAITTYWSILVNGGGFDDAILLFTRTYSFATMGITYTIIIDLEELFLNLEQKGIPSNFVYGILVVINAIPAMKQEIIDLKDASLYKGKKLRIFSPLFYFKTILTAIDYQKSYIEAMYSHGYSEYNIRTHYYNFKESNFGICINILYFISCNLILFFNI